MEYVCVQYNLFLCIIKEVTFEDSFIRGFSDSLFFIAFESSGLIITIVTLIERLSSREILL